MRKPDPHREESNTWPRRGPGNRRGKPPASLRFFGKAQPVPLAASTLLLLPVLLVLASCAPAPANQTPPPPLPPATELPSSTPLVEPSATPEILPAQPGETPIPTVTLLPAPPSTQTVEAMQLFFPTVIPVAGAEYRPPIYPVPWSLSPYDHFYFTRPLAATYPSDPEVDYLYGGIFFGPDVIHSGVDLPAPYDTDVLAAGPGTVVWAGYGLFSNTFNNTGDPYGMAVAIRHDFGYQDQPLYTVYAHMSDVLVILGQWVDSGSILGKVGSTGVATGPHLHFEVRLGKNDFYHTRNPELWMAPPQGYGVLVGQVMRTYGDIWLHSYPVIVKSLDTGQTWQVKTYADQVINNDAYYHENMALGGLPAGVYQLYIPYTNALPNLVYTNFQILPGQVTFFTFSGYNSYDFSPPPPSALPTP